MNKAIENSKAGEHGLRTIVALMPVAASFSFASLSLRGGLDPAPLLRPRANIRKAPASRARSARRYGHRRSVTAAELPWHSVWLGHFSGGRPYSDGYGHTLIDWRDEKFCFPERRECQAWVRELRQDYHRPEGYWTCLLLR